MSLKYYKSRYKQEENTFPWVLRFTEILGYTMGYIVICALLYGAWTILTYGVHSWFIG